MLWSSGRSVKFVVGSTLCEEDVPGFLRAESLSTPSMDTRKPAWMVGLSRYEMPFSMSLAARLSAGWESHLPVCQYLNRFSWFYRNNRTRIELAARELRLVLEGLFAVQSWPSLFRLLLDVMGERAATILPRGTSDADVAFFLGGLLVGTGPTPVSLAGLPEMVHNLRELPTGPAEACLRIPHYHRILDNLERSAERATPVVDQLCSALKA